MRRRLINVVFVLVLFLFLVVGVVIPGGRGSIRRGHVLTAGPGFHLDDLVDKSCSRGFRTCVSSRFIKESV